MVQAVEDPAHGLAVGRDQVEAIEPEFVLAVERAGHQAVHRESGNGCAAPLLRGAHYELFGGFVINGVDQDADDIPFACMMHSPLHRSTLNS